MLSPTDIVAAILKKPTDIKNVRSLVTDDVRAESIVKTFVDVGLSWEKQAFEIDALFWSGENVAMFGRFTYKSDVLAKVVTSPFAIFAKVTDGRCTYLQFMEDTFATDASFRSGGTRTFPEQSERRGRDDCLGCLTDPAF